MSEGLSTSPLWIISLILGFLPSAKAHYNADPEVLKNNFLWDFQEVTDSENCLMTEFSRLVDQQDYWLVAFSPKGCGTGVYGLPLLYGFIPFLARSASFLERST